jgi:hypothetical protein
LVDHPELLPVQDLRPDIGDLICIGREVSAGDSGSIDNLYLSTGGYPVIVETKLWRNPQARREVLSQILDYTKEVARKDYDWIEQQWENFSKTREPEANSLLDLVSEIAAEELDEHEFIDKVNRALDRGDIISLIVGDGIESRLQALVSHLCKDSAHLRYSLALIELTCYQIKDNRDLLVVPRIVREVEPIQRAYVKIDVAEELDKKITVQPIIKEEPTGKEKVRKATLTEEDFLSSLDAHVGNKLRKKVEAFYNDLIEKYDLEPMFGKAALMLKISDPLGERAGISIFAIERSGKVYNSIQLEYGLRKAGVEKYEVESICNEFWQELHQVDTGFSLNGIDQKYQGRMIPLQRVEGDLKLIDSAIGKAVANVRKALNQIAE